MNDLSWLDPHRAAAFPDTNLALSEPDGLLAVGGQLSTPWLIEAYRHGIFPWFNDGQPILWWSPAPRTILKPSEFHISKSLAKLDRQQKYKITVNQDFAYVIRACAKSRQQQEGTWINDQMIEAYINFHDAGYAASYECRNLHGQIVGGLYGVTLGEVFFGESMFSVEANSSKLCLKGLVESGQYRLIDCQMETAHLLSLGAQSVPREEFNHLLIEYLPQTIA